MALWQTRPIKLCACALAAVALTGCGSSTNRPAIRLKKGGEQQLLSLIARARSDTAGRDGSAVRAALERFATLVGRLRSDGQLTEASALRLEREATAAGLEAARELHRTVFVATHTSTSAGTPASAAAPGPAPTPAGGPQPPSTPAPGRGVGNPHPGGPPGQQKHDQQGQQGPPNQQDGGGD